MSCNNATPAGKDAPIGVREEWHAMVRHLRHLRGNTAHPLRDRRWHDPESDSYGWPRLRPARHRH